MLNYTKFEAGKEYRNDLTIKVISRTEKTLTIETTAWGKKRVKVKDYGTGTEYISFKAWMILATEEFNKEEAVQIAYEKAYLS